MTFGRRSTSALLTPLMESSRRRKRSSLPRLTMNFITLIAILRRPSPASAQRPNFGPGSGRRMRDFKRLANIALERTAGSDALAAAAHREQASPAAQPPGVSETHG